MKKRNRMRNSRKKTRRINSRKKTPYKRKTYPRKTNLKKSRFKKIKINRRKTCKKMKGGMDAGAAAAGGAAVDAVAVQQLLLQGTDPNTANQNHTGACLNPVWVEDAEKKECMICGDSFEGIMGSRRHHCRACGWIICRKCQGGNLEVDRWVSSTTGHKIKTEGHKRINDGVPAYFVVEKNNKKVCKNCEIKQPQLMALRPHEPLQGVRNLYRVDEGSLLFTRDPELWAARAAELLLSKNAPPLPLPSQEYQYSIGTDGTITNKNGVVWEFKHPAGAHTNPTLRERTFSYLMPDRNTGDIYAFPEHESGRAGKYNHSRLAKTLIRDGIIDDMTFISAGEFILSEKAPHKIEEINNKSGYFRPPVVSTMVLLNVLEKSLNQNAGGGPYDVLIKKFFPKEGGREREIPSSQDWRFICMRGGPGHHTAEFLSEDYELHPETPADGGPSQTWARG